jgi:hypothetical protein
MAVYTVNVEATVADRGAGSDQMKSQVPAASRSATMDVTPINAAVITPRAGAPLTMNRAAPGGHAGHEVEAVDDHHPGAEQDLHQHEHRQPGPLRRNVEPEHGQVARQPVTRPAPDARQGGTGLAACLAASRIHRPPPVPDSPRRDEPGYDGPRCHHEIGASRIGGHAADQRRAHDRRHGANRQPPVHLCQPPNERKRHGLAQGQLVQPWASPRPGSQIERGEGQHRRGPYVEALGLTDRRQSGRRRSPLPGGADKGLSACNVRVRARRPTSQLYRTV